MYFSTVGEEILYGSFLISEEVLEEVESPWES